MTDLIERQAAIDSIEKHLRFGDELYPLTDTDKVLNHAFSIAASCVYNLPSAQPDIIRCRNCKFASGDSRICMKFGHSPIGELDFCAWAERRTDE